MYRVVCLEEPRMAKTTKEEAECGGPPCPVKCQAGLGAIAVEAMGIRTQMQRVLEKDREPRDRATTQVWSLFCDCHCLCVYPEYLNKCWHTAYKRTTGYWEGLGDVRVIIQQHCPACTVHTRKRGTFSCPGKQAGPREPGKRRPSAGAPIRGQWELRMRNDRQGKQTAAQLHKY